MEVLTSNSRSKGDQKSCGHKCGGKKILSSLKTVPVIVLIVIGKTPLSSQYNACVLFITGKQFRIFLKEKKKLIIGLFLLYICL